MTIYFTIGLPGAGKSHFFDEGEHLPLGCQVICPDDVRKALGFEYNERTEPVVLMTCDVMARAHLERGLDVVVDATNLHQGLIDKYLRVAKQYGYNSHAYVINTSKYKCIARRAEKWDDETIQKVFYDKMIPMWEELEKNDFEIIRDKFDIVTIKNG